MADWSVGWPAFLKPSLIQVFGFQSRRKWLVGDHHWGQSSGGPFYLSYWQMISELFPELRLFSSMSPCPGSDPECNIWHQERLYDPTDHPEFRVSTVVVIHILIRFIFTKTLAFSKSWLFKELRGSKSCSSILNPVQIVQRKCCVFVCGRQLMKVSDCGNGRPLLIQMTDTFALFHHPDISITLIPDDSVNNRI